MNIQNNENKAAAIATQELLNRISTRGVIRERVVEPTGSSSEDVLTQLKSNVAELTDLHSRLKFMMREVAYLTKTR